ncbi:sigma 54-interacting transcriptional regulator, partial [Bacillus pumilus]|uniref:sigma 54-interacting transcriptional regulator n=1 Tax=Bacillus pumilus TaxID=1408 RepID=UPI0016435E88
KTNTTKELFKQKIHKHSSQTSTTFITQNSPPLPHNLIQTLLFATQKGPFTPAPDHPPLFHHPQGPTFLLHHINSLNPHLQ